MRRASALLPLILWAVAAFLSAAQPDKGRTTAGTIASIRSADRALEITLPDGSSQRFVWTPETKINGVLAPGAKVTVRYSASDDSRNVALQITVARN